MSEPLIVASRTLHPDFPNGPIAIAVSGAQTNRIEVVHTALYAKGVSAETIQTLTALLRYAAANQDVECYELPFSDFFALVGTDEQSIEAIKRLLLGVRKVLFTFDVFDPFASAGAASELKSGSSPLLGFVGFDSSAVWFELDNFVRREGMLNSVLALLEKQHMRLAGQMHRRGHCRSVRRS